MAKKQTMPAIVLRMEEIVLNSLPLIEETYAEVSTALLPDDPAEQSQLLEAQAETREILEDASGIIHAWLDAGERYKVEYDETYKAKLVPIAPPESLRQAEKDYLFKLACAVASLELLDRLEDDGISSFEVGEVESFRKELSRRDIDTTAIWPEPVL